MAETVASSTAIVWSSFLAARSEASCFWAFDSSAAALLIAASFARTVRTRLCRAALSWALASFSVLSAGTSSAEVPAWSPASLASAAARLACATVRWRRALLSSAVARSWPLVTCCPGWTLTEVTSQSPVEPLLEDELLEELLLELEELLPLVMDGSRPNPRP